MKQTSCVDSARAALDGLGINYKEFSLRKERTIFICMDPANDLTFDLECGEDGMILLWRFVGVVHPSKVGMHYKYRPANDPCKKAIAFEVVDEGNVSFSIQRRIDANDPEKNACIQKIIRFYIDLAASLVCVKTPR